MPPKKEKEDNKNIKLDELISKLEDRLAIFNENELKSRCLTILIEMKQVLEQLEEIHSKLYAIMGITYSDIHYPA